MICVNQSSLNQRAHHQKSQLPSLYTTEGALHSSSQSNQTRQAVLVSDNKFARLEPDNIKTKSTDEQSTDSKSKSSKDKIDVASANSTEKTSVTEGEQPSESTRTSSRNKNDKKDLEKLSLQTFLKREAGCNISRKSEIRL